MILPGIFKGQLGVPPNSVLPWYLLWSTLRFLGMILTHKYPRAKKGLAIGISHYGVRFNGCFWFP